MIKLGYVRTSKEEQHPENQVKALRELGVSEENIFVDAGISGVTQAHGRDAFDKLMAFIEDTEEKGILYVSEISRLGRTESFVENLNIVIDLEKRGWVVWSLSPQESWSRTEDESMRHFMIMLFSWVAARERQDLIRRTRAGLARARAEGKEMGRPFREIPWKKVDELVKPPPEGKGLTLSGASRLLDIPYSTLLKRNKQRKVD